MNKIQFGDCREIMRDWSAQGIKVQTCVTSPPYFGLRDYDADGQLGIEPTPDEYVSNLVDVFRCVRDILNDDGTVWLNLGDSYASFRDGKVTPDSARGDSTGTAVPKGLARNRMASTFANTPIKHKDLIGIPWRVAFALQADGWYLRQDIIWNKPNPMPESVKDRCTKSHEYIFLLTKSPKYYFDGDAIKEPAVSDDKRPSALKRSRAFGYNTKDKLIKGYPDNPGEVARGDVAPATRNRRSVWTVPTRPFRGAHFATFPAELIEPCILSGSRSGDIVLDPFMGSGTTAEVAIRNCRKFLGCELNSEYEKLQKRRLSGLQYPMVLE
jgi:DNA modification methylase